MLALQFVWDGIDGIDLGFFKIRFYSLMFVVGFLLGYQIMKAIFLRENVKLEILDKMFIYTIIATIVGARLGHYLFYDFDVLLSDPLSVFLPFKFRPRFEWTGFSGLASHGGILAILLSMYYFSRKVMDKSWLWIMDRIVIAGALAGMFIRIGNFFNSEMVGYPTDGPLGIVFSARGEDFARHPGQLYEAFGYLVTFLVIAFLYWKTELRKKQGLIFGIFLILLFSTRLIVENFKIEQVEGRDDWIGTLNTGQVLSIPFMLFAVGLIVYSLSRKQKPETPD